MLNRISYIIIFICIIFHYACKQRETELTICFTGDLLLDRGVREQIERKGSADFLFTDLAGLFRLSDAVVVNLECPVTDIIAPINKRFIFRGEKEWLQGLIKSGVTHAALANNHSMDQGRSGLNDTYKNLIDYGIEVLGYGKDKEQACSPVYVVKNEIEIALFNSVTIPLENWMYLEDKPGICQSSVQSLCENIEVLKKEKPECHVIVVLHWGLEYQTEPTISQRKEAYSLINAGADVIIGHHPHVIQKEEIYKGKPIFYSLGNFIFDQKKPLTKKGLIVRIVFQENSLRYEKYPINIDNCRPEL